MKGEKKHVFSRKYKNVPSVLTTCLSLHSLPDVSKNLNKSIIITCRGLQLRSSVMVGVIIH